MGGRFGQLERPFLISSDVQLVEHRSLPRIPFQILGVDRHHRRDLAQCLDLAQLEPERIGARGGDDFERGFHDLAGGEVAQVEEEIGTAPRRPWSRCQTAVV